MLLIRRKHMYNEGDREKCKKEVEIMIHRVRRRYKKELRGIYQEFFNLIRRWNFLIEGVILIQFFFLILSYYFNLVSLIEQDVHHLIDLVDQLSLPSMPKREIFEEDYVFQSFFCH